MPDLLPSAAGHTDAWLSVPCFLQNGSVAEAISLWKRNVDKEFEGGAVGRYIIPSVGCLLCWAMRWAVRRLAAWPEGVHLL